MFFSVIIKNLNWEILTKNLVTFKRWDGAMDKKISQKKTIYRGNCLKRGRGRGRLGQFADLRRDLEKKRWCLWGEGGWYPNAHTMFEAIFLDSLRSRS